MPPADETPTRLLEAAGVGTWEWEVKTGRVQWSENMEALHGLERGTFDGTFETYIGLVHLEDRQQLQAALEEALNRDAPYHVEYRERTADRSTVWLEARGTVQRDEDGQPTRMIGLCQAVTERKRTERIVQVLAEAGRILSESLDPHTTLENVARLVVPDLADWCGIDLVTETDEIVSAAVAHVNPDKVSRVREMRRRYPPTLEQPGGAGRPDTQAPG